MVQVFFNSLNDAQKTFKKFSVENKPIVNYYGKKYHYYGQVECTLVWKIKRFLQIFFQALLVPLSLGICLSSKTFRTQLTQKVKKFINSQKQLHLYVLSVQETEIDRLRNEQLKQLKLLNDSDPTKNPKIIEIARSYLKEGNTDKALSTIIEIPKAKLDAEYHAIDPIEEREELLMDIVRSYYYEGSLLKLVTVIAHMNFPSEKIKDHLIVYLKGTHKAFLRGWANGELIFAECFLKSGDRKNALAMTVHMGKHNNESQFNFLIRLLLEFKKNNEKTRALQVISKMLWLEICKQEIIDAKKIEEFKNCYKILYRQFSLQIYNRIKFENKDFEKIRDEFKEFVFRSEFKQTFEKAFV